MVVEEAGDDGLKVEDWKMRRRTEAKDQDQGQDNRLVQSGAVRDNNSGETGVVYYYICGANPIWMAEELARVLYFFVETGDGTSYLLYSTSGGRWCSFCFSVLYHVCCPWIRETRVGLYSDTIAMKLAVASYWSWCLTRRLHLSESCLQTNYLTGRHICVRCKIEVGFYRYSQEWRIG